MRKSYTDYDAPKPELYFDGEYIIFDSLEELAIWAQDPRTGIKTQYISR